MDNVTGLARDGYCVVPDALGKTMLKALLRRFDSSELAKAPDENFGDSGAFILPDYRDPVLVDLLVWPKTLDVLRRLGYPSPKLHSFYISAKPPASEALPWHSDLFYQYEGIAPTELFLIYYLQDTSRDNGCLRVVPGSHLWPHDKRHEQPDDTKPRNDEIDVPIKAGDLFVGDRRILHATHANNCNTWRTCLTIAYAPDYAALDDSVKALITRNRCLPPKGWQHNEQLKASIDPRLQDILPVYEGSATVASG